MTRGRRRLRLCVSTLNLLWRVKGVPKSTVSESTRSKIECWQSDSLPTWVKRGSNNVLGPFERDASSAKNP